MQYYLYLLLIPFFYLNYKIISSDIKYKKIPNKLLGYLLFLVPFYYIYLFSASVQIHIPLFLWSMLLTILVSFILYYYWVWSAGDAKYLLVLALFIPHIGIIPFLGNIALITLAYLLLYFLYFYFWKCLFHWSYAKSLYVNIYGDLKDRLVNFLKHGDGNFYKNAIFLKLLKWILLFLIFFVSIRLARLYLFTYIQETHYYIQLLEYFKNYTSYILFALIWVFIGIVYGIRVLIGKLKEVLKKKGGIENNTTLDFVLIGVLLIILIGFVVYEYILNPNEIKIYLLRIFTLYIALYWVFKILTYSYTITFQLAEQDFIDIKDLKAWDIVDKEYLAKMFGEQECLWAYGEKWILSPDPKDYFNKISNPIDVETKKILLRLYRITNLYHLKNKTFWISQNKSIKILKTFAFWWYIIIWFLITYFLWNFIFWEIISLMIEFFQKINS